MNSSGIVPVGRAVLVEPYEPEIKKSVIALPETVQERTTMAEVRAVVIAIGATAWEDESQPRAAVGDKVLITKFAGTIVIGTKDQKRYRIVNDRDIFCKIEVET